MPSAPPLPAISSRLTAAGFSIGHGTDRQSMTGVTVILCPEGATAAAEVRGSATGTRQFDSLVAPHHIATKAHALVMAGGSGFGLAAADPVVAHLRARGKGFRTPLGVVPLVPTAILYDLGLGDPRAAPSPALVEQAIAAAAAGPIDCGSVGAGTGATVGKARGLDCAMKGGFGFVELRATAAAGPTVAAAVAVNAWGDVRDPDSDALIAGCRAAPRSRRLVSAERVLARLPADAPHPWQGNTTLAAVLTDARLSKLELFKVCEMATGGLYRALAPAFSLYDGDLVVALASGRVPAHVHRVGVLAQHAVGQAIRAAVLAADGFGLLPAARDLPAQGSASKISEKRTGKRRRNS
jgi:L-aminopeptidase/D-esterase-like protein